MTSDNVIVQAFTEMAPQYEDTMNRELEQYWGISYHTFIERFLEQVPITAGDAILDVATGTARIPRALRDRVGADGCIVGLDITPAMLARGRAHGVADGGRAAVHLVCGSALELPFGDATYDGVVCALGTHHMDVPRMVAEMRRVLRPAGGLLWLMSGRHGSGGRCSAACCCGFSWYSTGLSTEAPGARRNVMPLRTCVR